VYLKPCGTEDDIELTTIRKCHPILLYEGVRYTLSCPDNSSYEWLQVKIGEPWLFGWVQFKPFVTDGSGTTEPPLVPVNERCRTTGTIGSSISIQVGFSLKTGAKWLVRVCTVLCF
jgi:hypothetical protein